MVANYRHWTEDDLVGIHKEHYQVARSCQSPFSATEFKSKYREMFPDRNEGSFLVSDYAYNNHQKAKDKFPSFLEMLDEARYAFIGLDEGQRKKRGLLDTALASPSEAEQFPINKALLELAVERNLRPQIEIDGCLEDDKNEGYQHSYVIPTARPLLTKESIESDAVGAVKKAIACNRNLLFGNENYRPLEFLENCDPEEARGKFLDLLHGDAPLTQRVQMFLDWAHWNKHQLDGKPIGFNPTIVSYLLCVSNPEKYAFCKPGRYAAAARALLGDGFGESNNVARLEHAAKFYAAVLEILRDEHGLPFSDLMHVHIAFHLLNSSDHGYPDWDQLKAMLEGDIGQGKKRRSMAKNLILYGPPGTGKTYSVVNETLSILDPGFLETHRADRGELKARFDSLKEEGRICFVTFHQSYSYEEFVEGIRPKTVEGQVHYEIEPGIFRQVCENELPKRSMPIRVGDSIAGARVVRITDDLLEIQSGRTGSVIPLPFSIIWELVDYVRDGKISIEDIGSKAVFDKTDSKLEKFLVNGYPQYYKEAVAKLLDEKEREETADQEWPRVLVIDEINRGNISKIFGELITLIEEDKRAGAKESLSVVLPYSGEVFSIPSDLYIIGTMNTADRSLAHIDTALRRRFRFKEMMPDSSLLGTVNIDGKSIDLRQMLDHMNQRIEALFDREHQIGHAYLMSVNDGDSSTLKNAFKNSILPLLLEYAFEDWAKVRTVLADDQVDDEALQFIVEIPVGDSLLGGRKVAARPNIYRLNNDALSNPDAYRKIYGG